MTNTKQASPPLEGVIVVALESAVSAPFATRQLADLGATVLKVERPDEGDFARGYDTSMDGSSAFFVWANRGKQSIELDLKDVSDRATLTRLITGADVFIQNLSPSAASRLGVLADQLRAPDPALIACDISGYGNSGPRANDKAYDLAIQAEGGAIALTGTAEEACKVGFSVADIASAMYAFSSILAALYRKQRTGDGASIEVSMLESLAEWTAAPTYAAVGRGAVPARSGRRHTMIAPYGTHTLADGAKVLIAVQNDRDWARFAEHVLLSPELSEDSRFATNGDRIDNVDALEDIISDVFRDSPASGIRSRLRRSAVAHGSLNGPLDVWRHEQLRSRGHFMEVTTPTARSEVYRPPFHLNDMGGPDPRVPALGEHDPALVEHLIGRSRPT